MNAVDVEKRKPQKQQGNNIKDWFPHTKRKGNSELTSTSLLIIHQNRMKYANGTKLEKEQNCQKQMKTNVKFLVVLCTSIAIFHLKFL